MKKYVYFAQNTKNSQFGDKDNKMSILNNFNMWSNKYGGKECEKIIFERFCPCFECADGI